MVLWRFILKTWLTFIIGSFRGNYTLGSSNHLKAFKLSRATWTRDSLPGLNRMVGEMAWWSRSLPQNLMPDDLSSVSGICLREPTPKSCPLTLAHTPTYTNKHTKRFVKERMQDKSPTLVSSLCPLHQTEDCQHQLSPKCSASLPDLILDLSAPNIIWTALLK